jgi:hypothetical protein
MRTTLDLDSHLLTAARELARSEQVTLTAVVERALAAFLAPRPAGGAKFRLQWTTRRGRFVGGVDLADRDALIERMEGRS